MGRNLVNFALPVHTLSVELLSYMPGKLRHTYSLTVRASPNAQCYGFVFEVTHSGFPILHGLYFPQMIFFPFRFGFPWTHVSPLPQNEVMLAYLSNTLVKFIVSMCFCVSMCLDSLYTRDCVLFYCGCVFNE